MSAEVTFDLPAGKTKTTGLVNVDAGTTPTWTVVSGGSTVTPAADALSATWLGAPAGDTTVVSVVSQVGGASDTKTLTAITYDAGTGGGGSAGPGLVISSPA